MGNTYTEEDKQAFRLKDYLNSRMSAVKATSVIFEGKAVEFKEFQTFAEKVLNWLWEGQGEPPCPLVQEQNNQGTKKVKKAVAVDFPVPTAAQENILNQIAKITNLPLDKVKEHTLDYAKNVLKLSNPIYPAMPASVEPIVNYVKEKYYR